MTQISNEKLIEQLQWRYATKRFDPQHKISDHDWKTLKEALTLSPSSYGLQPWKFLIVSNPEIRSALRKVSWNQPQIEEASEIVVFCVRTDVNASFVDHYIDDIAKTRGVSKESLADYRGMMLGSLGSGKTAEQIQEWSTRQVYLALGVFLSATSLLGIDACPMEGFQNDDYDALLGLKEKSLHAVVVAAAGYRSADDHYAKLAKVRFPENEVIEEI